MTENKQKMKRKTAFSGRFIAVVCEQSPTALVFRFVGMLGSSTWSAGARPPRPRSAKLSSTSYPKKALASARPDLGRYETNNDEEEEVVEDDDGDDEEEFGAAAELEHTRRQLQKQSHPQQRRHWSGKQPMSNSRVTLKSKFRPSSAPAGRPKSASNARGAPNKDDKRKRSSATISIAYLRAAAEKKKARDREFARELFREETEFRKKITIKIEQANKMMAAIGSSKSFSAAPDREGTHMIRVHDPTSGDRVISVEIFLREFEQLATVPLGQTMQLHPLSPTSTSVPGKAGGKSSLQRSGLDPRSRLSARPSSSARDAQWEGDGFRSRAKVKPADRTQVQEELRDVLESTIELTKVLQEQLHELKLKGWNVAPRSCAG